MTENFLENLEGVRRLDISTTERLRALFADSTERLKAQSDLARALVFETVGRRRDLAERRGQTARMHAGVASLLQDGVDRGDVRSNVSLSLLAKMVAGAYLEILLSWVVDPDYPLGEELDLAAQILESSLSPASSNPTS
jgi:hypothetical protein